MWVMAMRRPRKTWQKVGFWALILVIAFGLVGPSVAGLWGMGGDLEEQAEGPDSVSRQDQLASQLKELERRVEADPGDIASRVELAVHYKRMMDYEQAIVLFEEVLALDASNQRARIDLAEMYFVLEDYDRAVEQLEALLQANPNHQLGLYLYGITLGFGKEDYPGAVRALERFLSLADSGPNAEHARALIAEWEKN